MARVAKDAFGRIDLLVNNAGTTKFALATDLEAVNADDWLRIYRVNVVGAFQATRAVQQTMLAGGGGQVINITSVAAFAARGSSIPYCASKGALNNLTIALARALAPKIRVNAIAPGFITGRWLEQGLGGGYEQAMNTVAGQCPLEKVSDPDDIAAAILSLVNGSPMVTGQILVCDGGMLIGK
jgi:3-oxoacyl-[acyl-carrier protein] reductase